MEDTKLIVVKSYEMCREWTKQTTGQSNAFMTNFNKTYGNGTRTKELANNAPELNKSRWHQLQGQMLVFHNTELHTWHSAEEMPRKRGIRTFTRAQNRTKLLQNITSACSKNGYLKHKYSDCIYTYIHTYICIYIYTPYTCMRATCRIEMYSIQSKYNRPKSTMKNAIKILLLHIILHKHWVSSLAKLCI